MAYTYCSPDSDYNYRLSIPTFSKIIQNSYRTDACRLFDSYRGMAVWHSGLYSKRALLYPCLHSHNIDACGQFIIILKTHVSRV